MFVYATRKLKMLLETGYADSETMKKVANEGLEGLEEEEKEKGVPEVVVSSSFWRCLRDNSIDVQFEAKDNKVFVCKKLVKSEQGLRGAVEREKVWIRERRKLQGSGNDEEARGVIRACRAEMRVFGQLDPVLKEEAAKLCAKVHSKLKITNKLNRNPDTWHFYTRQLIEDNWYIY